ncbi:MAG: DciA family protein, partial [Gammaproteobacteria bacterium]
KKVIDKKENIDSLNLILNESIETNLQNKIRVINYSDTCITIECDDSSVASIMRFEKDKYLDIFNKNDLCNIRELKVKVR